MATKSYMVVGMLSLLACICLKLATYQTLVVYQAIGFICKLCIGLYHGHALKLIQNLLWARISQLA